MAENDQQVSIIILFIASIIVTALLPESFRDNNDSGLSISAHLVEENPYLFFQPVNINLADIKQLELLPGIGPTLAARIVAYRHTSGGFLSLAELQQVQGVGPKKIAAIRQLITVALPQ